MAYVHLVHCTILRLVSAPPSAGTVLAHLLRCAQAYVHLVGQRPAPRTAPSCALYLHLRLLGRCKRAGTDCGGPSAAFSTGLVAKGAPCRMTYVHLVGQRPAPRTAPSCALYLRLRLLGRLGAAAAQRPDLTGRVWRGYGVAGWLMCVGGAEARGLHRALV